MKKNKLFTSILFILLFQLSSLIYIDQFSLQDNSLNTQQEDFSLKTSATRLEYQEINGTKEDATYLEIDLPDNSWNITNININFTNIKLHRRVRAINDNMAGIAYKNIFASSSYPYYTNYSLATQFNCTEPTTVYGAYLYCKQSIGSSDYLFTEIRGCDQDPFPNVNSTVYTLNILNISESLGWHYQDFSENPPELGIESYYVYVNGIMKNNYSATYSFGYSPSALFHWNSRFERHMEYDMFVGYYWDSTEWVSIGNPYLCKLVEKVNRTYYPEDLEMKAEINEILYDINNTNPAILGEGNLTVDNINFYHNDDKINIPITDNNESIQLYYDLNYSISLQKLVTVPTPIGGGGGDGNGDVTKITGIAPEVLYLFIAFTIIGIASALGSYQAVKKVKAKKRRYRETIFNKYMDVLNLNYVFVKEKNSGLNIYEQIIGGKKMDLNLVSGFLDAIKAFGLEFSGSEESSQTIKLEYQKSKVLMSEYKDFRIVNILEEPASKDFVESLDQLAIDIDTRYSKLIKNFDGEITQFEGIRNLLEKHLNLSLIYPLKVAYSKDTKLDRNEKILVNQALDVMKQKSSKYFYVSNLMTSQKDFNPHRAETILELINKKVFQPVI
ncbi:MAG: hypothetical protein ACFFAO_06910 [Candidatus Hermodarchaeota archaeon]